MKSLVFFFFFILSGLQSVFSSTLYVDIAHAPKEVIVEIKSIYGIEKKLEASFSMSNGTFNYPLDSIPFGMLKLFFGNRGPVIDIIHDGKDIRLSFDALQPNQTLSFTQSKSNQNYLTFLHKSAKITKDWLGAYKSCTTEKEISNNCEFNLKENSKELKDLMGSYTLNKKAGWKNIIGVYQGLPDRLMDQKELSIWFEQQTLKSIRWNDDATYRSFNIGEKFNKIILRNFDNSVDFETQNNLFIALVDRIVKFFPENQECRKMCLELLWKSFQLQDREFIMEYIDTEYLAVQCEVDGNLEIRLNSYKQTAVGALAPNIITNNYTLSDSESPHTLLVFWASWCPHCEKSLPLLYQQHQKSQKDLEVVAISLDQNLSVWQEIIRSYPEWIHIRAEEEWENIIVKSYGVYATPTMIYLDKDKKVIGKAKDLNALKNLGIFDH